MTIDVKGNNWGEGRPQDIKVLLEDVASHMTRHLRESVHAVIEVQNSAHGPQILFREPQQSKYAILLNTGDRLWAQYSFQFAHEFCHLLSDYERLQRNPNSWFHESICETASLFTLRNMATAWEKAPPYPNWRSYARLHW